jgi:hypothetical protein
LERGHPARIEKRSAKAFAYLVDEVSTESGSDRVIVSTISTVAWIATRSLPLSVLTSSPDRRARLIESE